jgi:hypothetical protein
VYLGQPVILLETGIQWLLQQMEINLLLSFMAVKSLRAQIVAHLGPLEIALETGALLHHLLMEINLSLQ